MREKNLFRYISQAINHLPNKKKKSKEKTVSKAPIYYLLGWVQGQALMFN